MSTNIYDYSELVLSEIALLNKIRSLNRPYRKTIKDFEKYVIIPTGKKCKNGCGKLATVCVRHKGGQFLCHKIPAKCPIISEKSQLNGLTKEERTKINQESKQKIDENGKTSAQRGAEKMRAIDPITGLTRAQMSATMGAKKRIRSGRVSLVEGRKKEYRDYKTEVYRHSAHSYYFFKNRINPEDKEIGRKKYHIDHIYSIIDGFLNNIPPEVVGHYVNLQMLFCSENSRKNNKSWMSKEELYDRYQKITMREEVLELYKDIS